jgi:tripartite-type tricarboxylate transporter receptor subunit TctC
MLSTPQISLRAKQLLCLAALLPTLAFSQAWPTKQPIKLVAVFPPGGSVDQVSRIIAPVLAQQLGQSVVVENKGGASGVIGTASVLSAPADGYTFAVVFDTHGVNQSLIPNMPYDSKKDIVPLILVGTSAMVLTSNVGNEYKTFADVVAAAKAKKNVSFGTIGNGSLGHLAMALLGKNCQHGIQPYSLQRRWSFNDRCGCGTCALGHGHRVFEQTAHRQQTHSPFGRDISQTRA